MYGVKGKLSTVKRQTGKRKMEKGNREDKIVKVHMCTGALVH
jgi:hypothetical protein